MAESVAKVEAENLGYTLGDVKVLTLADAVAKVEAKTFGDLKCNDRAETLEDTLAEKLAEGQFKVLVYTLAANLAKVKTHTLGVRDIG